MHSKSNNIKFTSFDAANEFVDELFESLCSRYLDDLEKSMTGSECILSRVQLIHCKCHGVNFRRNGLFVDSTD